jgi:hypothetical protein
MDFLTIKPSNFSLEKYENIICIGNPPFGKQNNLAIKFFNECASINNVKCIAMIFPKSFRKKSIQDKLNFSFHLILEIDIPDNSFISSDGNTSFNIPCVFQTWKRTDIKRIKSITPTLIRNDLIEFTKNPDTGCLAIRRVGFYAGKVECYKEHSLQSHYFIKCKTRKISIELMNFLNSIKWEHNDTVGPRLISKTQYIEKINILLK